MTVETMITRTVQIHFPVGLHVRPATLIAQEARKYQAEVFLVYNDRKASARNVFDMFLLGAEKGAQIKLEAAECDDAQQAMDGLSRLFAPESAQMHLAPDET